MAFHIRGMIWLRQGKLPKAIECFRRGLQDSPWEQNRQYFRTALSLAYLRKQRFEDAEALLSDHVIPALYTARNTLKLHVLAATGRALMAKEFSRSIQPFHANPRRELFDSILSIPELSRKESSKANIFKIYSEECDQILLAA
jgi:tetratricopeptide (TPR) repeat protein